MESILLRSLPVSDPASLVVVKWRSGVTGLSPAQEESVFRGAGDRAYRDGAVVMASIFSFPAFERLQDASGPVLSAVFAYLPAGNLNVIVDGESELARGEYVSGDFFRGLAVVPVAGRLLVADDDRVGATPVVVISMGYSQRRFGGAANAVGQLVRINNVAFTVVGVTPSGFFGVEPGANPDVYLPIHSNLLFDPDGADGYFDQNRYWLGMMGRLRPGVSLALAEAVLATPFEQWAASVATEGFERNNLPVLRLEEGARGLDTLRRRYSKPLYVLLAMVGLILAIACANTANLLLARATVRRREMALRLSIGAGRLRVVRQLLTESIVLASLSGMLGILIAMAGTGVLTRLLANGPGGFRLQPDLNWHVLLVTLGVSLLCGVAFGLVPAIRSSRPALMPTLKDSTISESRTRVHEGLPRLNLTQTLVVSQIAISLLLLVAAGLFVRTLSNLRSIEVGFNPDNVLLFELNASQAGYTEPAAAAFYANLRRRVGEIPGVHAASLSNASLMRAGWTLPITVNGVPAAGTQVLSAGPDFFPTMQIPMLQGREIDERDRQGTRPVVVVSDVFAREYFGDEIALGRRIRFGDHPRLPTDVRARALEMEVVGVAATARYGGLKAEIAPVVYVPYAQITWPALEEMTYVLRTEGDPRRYISAVREVIRQADARVPITDVRTQTAEIDQTINQEIVFARLCTAFAILALVIACVGLYGTMAYTVGRRTNEIGIRMALGARRGTVIWMVLRQVCVLAALGLAISLPIALGTSRLVASLLFDTQPNDPVALAAAVSILLAAALLAGYGPARGASRISPMSALRQD
jgi:predicted permease